MCLTTIKKIIKNRKGSVDAVLAVVLILAVLMVGSLIFVQLYDQTIKVVNQMDNATAKSQAMAFLGGLSSTGWSAMQMMSIAAIVIAAIVIIGFLYRIRGGTGI